MKKRYSYRTGLMVGAGLSAVLAVMNIKGYDTTNLLPYFLGAICFLFGIYSSRPYFDLLKSRKIYNEGTSTTAIVDEVLNFFVNPKYLERDEDNKFILPENSDDVPVKLNVHVHYFVGGERKDAVLALAPMTEREMRPVVIKAGEEVPVKYLEKYPDYVVIDSENMWERCEYDLESEGHKGLFTTVILAIIYGYYFYTRILK